MCGGRGLRLHPLTEHTPKPLIEVGGKPMLETILDGFIAQGFKRFVLCENYRWRLIYDHFRAGEKWGVEIVHAIEDENRPEGTAGALRHIKPPLTDPVIVTNADVIAKLDYHDLLAFHAKQNALATMCLAHYPMQVPYGVVTLNNGSITAVQEKPIQSFIVNAGIYVLDPAVIETIDGPCNMPDVLGALPEGRLAGYQIRDHWHDVGTFTALEAARAQLG